MCYHTKHTKRIEQVKLRYEVDVTGKQPIGDEDFYFYHANGYSHRPHLIIPQEEPSVVTPALWGILPPNSVGAEYEDYYKKAVKFGGGLNAQSEKLFDHFIYKQSAMTRRCLIPLNGFYEVHTTADKFKIPFHIGRKDDELFSVAGIYTITADGYVSMTILTKKATSIFEKVHNTKKRQPVILSRELESVWLEDGLTTTDIDAIIHRPYNVDEISAYPVSKDLLSPRHDSNTPEILNPINYPELNGMIV